MRQSVTLRLDSDLLKAARAKAASENLSLSAYVEQLLRRDLQMMAAPPIALSPR